MRSQPFFRSVACVWALSVTPTPLAAQAPPLGQAILRSPAWVCDGATRYIPTWIAPAQLSIRRVEVFLGTSGSLPGQPFPPVDVMTAVYSSQPTGFLLALVGLDHYAPFTGLHQLDKVFPPDQAPSLPAGGKISVGHLCLAWGGLPAYSQTTAVVTYILTP